MDMYSAVPFGNSVFQIMHFTDGREAPERRYRHCLLQLSHKRRALKECEFRRKRYDIDIKELKEKILEAEGFAAQRLKIDLAEIEYAIETEIKLIEDCVIEIAAYEKILADLPTFTRGEFEKAEQVYWEKKLIGDARREYISCGSVAPQTIQSLENIGIFINKDEKGRILYDKRDILCIHKTDKH